MKRLVVVFWFIMCAVASLAMAQGADAPVIKVQIYTPDSSVKFALADLTTNVPEEEQPYTRYLSLYNVPKEERRRVAATVSFAVNSLGTRRKMYIPVFVGGTDETLIRLNIDHYEWNAKIWDDLASKGSGPNPLPEPYFHAFLDKIVSGEDTKKTVTKKVTKTRNVFSGYSQSGQPVYQQEQYQEDVTEEQVVPGESKKKKVFAGAPWIDQLSLASLIKATQAESPILRADWFVVNALLPPAYYNFLRLGKKDEDFEKLIFADEKLAKKARSQDKAVVITSTVARNNRTLTRSPTFTKGYYWVSHDSKTSVDDRQYVQNLLNEKFDATEDIGTLPNGLQAYFLTDGAGNRLDEADINIAIDNTAVDRVVRNGRSCIICHIEGIKILDDEIRTLTKKLQNKEEVKLLVTKKEDAYRIDDLFSSDLDKQIIKDQNLYAEAIAASTGLKTTENAKNYASIYDAYAEHLLTKDVVAKDLGIPLADLEKYVRNSTDNVVLGLIKNPIRAVRRDQWERSFQGLMIIVVAARANAVPIQPQAPFIELPKKK